MATRIFRPMIWIREGPVMVRPIESVEAALAFLEHWRRDRGVVFYFTKVELEKALVGEIDVDQPRKAFWRFAEDVNILGENAAV